MQSAKFSGRNPAECETGSRVHEDVPMIPDELRLTYEAAIRADIPRSVLIEVSQSFPLAAEQAHTTVLKSKEIVEGGVALSSSRAKRAVGLLRFQVLDQAFEEIVIRNGGEIINRVPIEHSSSGATEASVYLTTGKFGGTLLGFASHRETSDLPVKNASRRVLCSQNRGLTWDFFRSLERFDERDRFALILARRNTGDISKIDSLTISLIDPQFEDFLFQANLNEFLAAYGEHPKGDVRKIVLRRGARRFKDKDGSNRSSGTD